MSKVNKPPLSLSRLINFMKGKVNLCLSLSCSSFCAVIFRFDYDLVGGYDYMLRVYFRSW